MSQSAQKLIEYIGELQAARKDSVHDDQILPVLMQFEDDAVNVIEKIQEKVNFFQFYCREPNFSDESLEKL
jgi:hypothetical protein